MSFMNMNSEENNLAKILAEGSPAIVHEQALEETLNAVPNHEELIEGEDNSPISCIKHSVSLATFTEEAP